MTQASQQGSAGVKEPPTSPDRAKEPGRGAGTSGKSQMRPALLNRFRDLAKLRYDFPLVLMDHPSEPPV
ncbi:MAG: hypothetical protein ACYTAF_13865, partial [Planctomycetota bacterium]